MDLRNAWIAPSTCPSSNSDFSKGVQSHAVLGLEHNQAVVALSRGGMITERGEASPQAPPRPSHGRLLLDGLAIKLDCAAQIPLRVKSVGQAGLQHAERRPFHVFLEG